MIRHVVVVVPANNEEDHISSCLAALDRARGSLHRRWGEPMTSRVVVVLDDCQDGTAARVARHPDVEAVSTDVRQVGAARKLGSEHALLHAAMRGMKPSETWLANTDADSVVPSHWLSTTVAFANAGSQVVLGTVMPGPGLAPRVRSAWYAAHHLSEGHSHVHGANFGIRADVYSALGGWSQLTSGEDEDLAMRADAAGFQFRRTARIPVLTSARAVARAPHGFSSYLRTLAALAKHEGDDEASARLFRGRATI
jgi:cellulose synthase/poly-beta-1,6-N-acetylglucosamine synthase-like glycosyltransferase